MSEAFERKLEELARTRCPEDPTVAWKAEILSRAQSRSVTLLPPRWLTLSLAASWAAIAIFQVSLAEMPACPPPSHPDTLLALHHLQSELELP
jgi:hypothetical protein